MILNNAIILKTTGKESPIFIKLKQIIEPAIINKIFTMLFIAKTLALIFLLATTCNTVIKGTIYNPAKKEYAKQRV